MGERIYTTASVAVLGDTNLTSLELRLYLQVSMHDGMSMLKGKGKGCVAANKTMFESVNCNYSSGCRALSSLVEKQYLKREKKGRLTVYRVYFPTLDMLQSRNLSKNNGLQDCNVSSLDMLPDGKSSPDNRLQDEHFDSSKTREKPSESHPYYSPPSGELDSVKTGELDSVETARLKSRETLAQQCRKWNVPVSPPRKHQSPGQVLAMLERDIKDGRSDLDVEDWDQWLTEIIETESRPAVVQQASRIYESLEWESTSNRAFQQ